MKKFLKLMLGIGGCLFYYFLAFELADFGDPWDKMMSWMKGDKKVSNHKKGNKQRNSNKVIKRKYTSINNREE